MPLAGVQQIVNAIEDDEEANGIDIAEYEDEVDFGSDSTPDLRGTAVSARGTKTVLVNLYDEFGNARPVHRGAQQYYLGKRRVDRVTGKRTPVFFSRLPKQFLGKDGKRKPLVDGKDYLTCPIGTCRHPVQLDQNMRIAGSIPEEQREFALKVAKDEHIRVFHPRQYIYYADADIRDRREAITKR